MNSSTQNCPISSIPTSFPTWTKPSNGFLTAMHNNEPILVYGDNDVDGMTAAALLTEFLRALGAKVFFDIPNRAMLKKSLMGDALQFAIGAAIASF